MEAKLQDREIFLEAPLQRAVAALALLAGGLLLLGGLLADVETGLQDAAQEAQEYWYERAQVPPDEDFEPPQDLELGGGQVDHMELDSELVVDLPEGTRIDDDTLELSEPISIRLRAGTQIKDLDVRLPSGTQLTLTDSARVRGSVLELGKDATIAFPNGARLLLPEGGRLSDHGMDTATLRDAVAQQESTLEQEARLQAPLAEVLRDWQVVLDEGSRIELPPDGGDAEPRRGTNEDSSTSDATHYTVPSGSQIQQGGYAQGHSLQAGADGHAVAGTGTLDPSDENGDDGAGASDEESMPGVFDRLGAPPVWSWFLLAATLVSLSGLVGVRRARLALSKRETRVRATYQIDERGEGLPLGLAPDQNATVHIKLQKRGNDGTWHDHEAPAKIRLGDRPPQTRTIGKSGIALPLSGLGPGDHPLRLRVRGSLWVRRHGLETTLRVAPWPEQIARDYQALVDTLAAHHDVTQGATPRQVRRFLHEHLPGIHEETADRLVAAFEEANYSPRTIAQNDWISFATRAQACADAVHALDTKPGRPARGRPPASATPLQRRRSLG